MISNLIKSKEKMTKICKNVSIQCFKGKNKEDKSKIRLFSSLNVKKVKPVYKFNSPKKISLKSLNSVKKIHLINSEVEISTKREVIIFSDKQFKEEISTSDWCSEKEFERFIRFAKRYANSQSNN
tara:strand:+ start:906 stop:1280 length:375 start_codon:yes stop_codon:yes gene_type:complete